MSLTVSKEDFITWVNDNKWLACNEFSTPSARQTTYVTPAGHIVIAAYDLKGELINIVPMPPAQPVPMSRNIPGLDLRGGQHFPG